MIKNMDPAKTINEITLANQKIIDNEEADYISYDAPPLDFSFKNIKNLQQLKDIQPRQGQKKVQHQVDLNVKLTKQQKDINQLGQAGQQGEVRGDKKKNEVIKLLPQNNLNSVVSNLVSNSAMKNISSKAKQQLQKKKKKAIHIKLVCASLMLGYNKIRQLTGLNTVLASIMDKPQNLLWIDVSHNYITTIDYNFQHFKTLKTLYLHCNFIADIAQLQKLKHLQQLKTFTIHGNPLTAIPNFRILTISILNDLKKLDSVLISKKQRDNAVFIRSQTKKYPLVKNAAKPPQEKEQDEQQQKQ